MRMYPSLMGPKPPNVEEAFDKGASLKEGVSGRVRIESEYPNNLPPTDLHPRTESPIAKNPVEESDYDCCY
jgi:hypothetical protein